MPSNNVWASKAPKGDDAAVTHLVLPSGQECDAKPLGMEGILLAGVLSDVDQLTAIISRYTRKVKGANGKADGEHLDEAALLKDPEALRTLIGLADRMIPVIVVDPVVKLHYVSVQMKGKTYTKRLASADREPNTVYTDQIDLEDKFFLFQWAMSGTEVTALETFRPDANGGVGSLANESGVPSSTKSASRGKRRR